MKNYIFPTLLIILMSSTIVLAQTKKPTTNKKPKTTVSPKTTTTTSSPVVKPPAVERETTTTTTITTTPSNTTKPSTSTSSTTIIQSAGPSKGGKVKNEKVKEDNVEVVKEPKYKKIKTPRGLNGSSTGVKFGIRAEASQFITFETGVDIAFSPGFNAGLIVNIPLNETFAIQPEILYAMGVQQSNEIAGSFEKFTTGSILTPVTLNINLGQGSTKFMVNVGGYTNYYLNSTSETTIAKVKTSMSNDLTGIDRFSYGTVLGLGMKLNKSILIEARSFYDLKNTNNKSMLATLGIGYLF